MPTLSLGKRGALLAHEGKVFRAVPPTIEKVINAVGSGDSFVAGLAVALDRGASPEEALRLAAACGTANVLEAESGVVNPEKVAAIEKEVTNYNRIRTRWEGNTPDKIRAFDKITSYRKPCYIKYQDHPSSDTRPILQSSKKIRILKTHYEIKKATKGMALFRRSPAA